MGVMLIRMVFIATGWPEEKTDLTQVKSFLDTEGIRYMGTVNGSQERIDLIENKRSYWWDTDVTVMMVGLLLIVM